MKNYRLFALTNDKKFIHDLKYRRKTILFNKQQDFIKILMEIHKILSIYCINT